MFVKQNRDDWKSLEQILKKVTKRKTEKTLEIIEEFQFLYQKAAHHLSFAQTYFPNEDVTIYLNELVSKAHNILYQDQVSSISQIKQFFSRTFIQLLDEQRSFVFIAFILFLIGAIGAFIAVYNDPLHLYTILPDKIAYALDPNKLGQDPSSNQLLYNSPSISAEIMTNNIQVAFLAFAGGLTLGILSVYLVIYNGIILGAIAALFLNYGKFYIFWAYILPHGIIELTAIFIATGSGLLMGYKILVPGQFPRSYQLKRQAIRSVQLLLGTIPLFIIAGIIEGYITPAPISLEAKYIVSILTVVALIFYVWLGKRMGKNRKSIKVPLD